jgi:hypothetical protein
VEFGQAFHHQYHYEIGRESYFPKSRKANHELGLVAVPKSRQSACYSVAKCWLLYRQVVSLFDVFLVMLKNRISKKICKIFSLTHRAIQVLNSNINILLSRYRTISE